MLVDFCPFLLIFLTIFALYILENSCLSQKGSSQYVFIVSYTIYQNKITFFDLLALLLLNFTWANFIVVTPAFFIYLYLFSIYSPVHFPSTF